MYIRVYMGLCLQGKHPSAQLFSSLAKALHAATKTVPAPHPLVIEMIEEFPVAFVKRSVSFLRKQRSGSGASLAGERIVLPNFFL